MLQRAQLVSDLGPGFDALGVAGALELFDSLFDDPRCALAIPGPAGASIDGGGVIKAGIHRRHTRVGGEDPNITIGRVRHQPVTSRHHNLMTEQAVLASIYLAINFSFRSKCCERLLWIT